MNNLKGFAFGILTSATFGLIPLLSGIRNAYHAVVFPGKDILDYLDGDRFGNLRGGTSFDR